MAASRPGPLFPLVRTPIDPFRSQVIWLFDLDRAT